MQQEVLIKGPFPVPIRFVSDLVTFCEETDF